MEKLRPQRLGHLVLAVRDIHASVKFYTEIMGLQVSDWISDQMVFLRAGTDHHDLALSQIPKDSPDINDLPRYTRPGMEHFSYLVEDRAEMDRTAEVLQAHGVENRAWYRQAWSRRKTCFWCSRTRTATTSKCIAR